LSGMLAKIPRFVSSGRGASSPGGGAAGGDDNGRVFEAIAGNENWHRASPQSHPRRHGGGAHEPVKLLAFGERAGCWEDGGASTSPAAVSLYRVTYSPRVMVRARPSLGGACLGARKRGEVVRCTAQHRAQEGEAWVRLADGFRESKQWRDERGLEAWMMVQHPELGQLMKHAGGCSAADLPRVALQLPSSSTAAAAIDSKGTQKRQQQAGRAEEAGGRHCERQRQRAVGFYKVVHSPSVMVRDKPNMSGKIVRALRTGTIVRTKGKQGNWLKIETGSGGDNGGGASVAPSSQSWIMCRHTELGVFAERCQPDGSSYYF